MTSIRNALERLLDRWLAQVVDAEQRVQRELSAHPALSPLLDFRVLTPTVQRRIDESA